MSLQCEAVCRMGFSAYGTCLRASFFLPLKGLHLAVSFSSFKNMLPWPLCRTRLKFYFFSPRISEQHWPGNTVLEIFVAKKEIYSRAETH